MAVWDGVARDAMEMEHSQTDAAVVDVADAADVADAVHVVHMDLHCMLDVVGCMHQDRTVVVLVDVVVVVYVAVDMTWVACLVIVMLDRHAIAWLLTPMMRYCCGCVTLSVRLMLLCGVLLVSVSCLCVCVCVCMWMCMCMCVHDERRESALSMMGKPGWSMAQSIAHAAQEAMAHTSEICDIP